jgi:hypothetical protein
MQFLDLFGVYKESYKLMFSWKKLLNQITSIIIIPLTFNILNQLELSNVLFQKILHYSNQIDTNPPYNTPQQQKLIESILKEWTIFFLIKIAYFILILVSYLIFNKVMSVVTNLSKILMRACVCTLMVVFNIAIISTLKFGVRSGGNSIFMIFGILYLVGTLIWQLANFVTTVLEDSNGCEAKMKSEELIKAGRLGLNIIITLKFNFGFFVMLLLFWMLVVNGWKHSELSLMKRIAIRFVCFLLLCYSCCNFNVFYVRNKL